MTIRKIQYLANSKEFLRFVEKYNLKSEVVNNEKILLKSECLVFEIYGLVVEDFFYFDIYSINLEHSSTLNVLLSDFDSEKLSSIYQLHVSKRKNVLITDLQGDESNTLKAEQYFFTMFQLMDELLSNVLTCEKKIKKEYWSDIFEYKKNQLKMFL